MNIAIVDDPKVWDPQRATVRTIEKHLAAHMSGKTTGSALIQMPTGTGKTGAIALAANCLGNHRPILVLSPRIALCEQLENEISHRFFDRVLPHVKETRKKVFLWEGGDDLPAGSLDDLVIVSTIQKLQRTFATNAADHGRLAAEVGLVMVDEGHYEPALQWREAIRNVPAAKVIFTATPFRNDFKIFDIDFAHVFRLSRAQALAERYIRDVSFVPRTANDIPAFVRDVVKFYDDHFGKEAAPDKKARVIIRCDNDQTIRSIAAELDHLKQSRVAIHEQLDNRPDLHEYRNVPDPRVTDATYWIHQYKLLEGIDDPRFRLLAVVPGEELGSVRAVVQQVGRVLRNPTRKKSDNAFALDHGGGRLKALWDNFLEYENFVDKNGLEHLDLSQRLTEGLKKALPDLLYIDGRFRGAASLENIQPYVDLRLPLSANLFSMRPGFSMQLLATSLERVFRDEDQLVQPLLLEYDLYVAVHVQVENSPLLANHFFLEPQLCVTVAYRTNDVLFFLDSGGETAVGLPCVGVPLPPRMLKKLFKRSMANRLTSISLISASLAGNAMRTRSFTAASIAQTVPAFDDKASIPSTAKGSVAGQQQQLVPRYLGFGSGRLSDSSGVRHGLHEYLAWAREIAAQVKGTGTALGEFSRYAMEAPVPPDPTPRHILLDVDGVADEFQTRPAADDAGRERLAIEDAAATITPTDAGKYCFTVQVNGKACRCYVEFDDTTERYYLSSSEINARVAPRDIATKETLIRYLNREQSFRIIPASENYFYVAGHFFKPGVKFGPEYDDDALNIFKLLEPCDELVGIKSEKGNYKLAGTRWQKGSIFQILDERGANTPLEAWLGDANVVVCDDLQTESSDFIFARVRHAEPCVIFVHAKCAEQGKTEHCSASGLTEVIGQATKNAKYLAQHSTEAPPKSAEWHTRDWKREQLGPIKRIRRLPPGANEADVWSIIHGAIRDWRTRKEIWIVLGRSLSIKEFKKQLTSDPPEYEAIQAAMLLLSAAQAAGAVGARLRVFCMP